MFTSAQDVKDYCIITQDREPLIEEVWITALEYADCLHQQRSKEELYKKCLQDIIDPLPRMKKQCEDNGSKLNGQIAAQLMNDPNYLREIAKEALK